VLSVELVVVTFTSDVTLVQEDGGTVVVVLLSVLLSTLALTGEHAIPKINARIANFLNLPPNNGVTAEKMLFFCIVMETILCVFFGVSVEEFYGNFTSNFLLKRTELSTLSKLIFKKQTLFLKRNKFYRNSLIKLIEKV